MRLDTPVRAVGLSAIVIASAIATSASAATMSINASAASGNYGANATFLFDDAANTLKVTLQNTGSTAAAQPWLDALFFNLTRNGNAVTSALTIGASDVAIAAGSTAVWKAGVANGSLVNYGGSAIPAGLWGYKSNVFGYAQGLSCTGGSGVFGSNTKINGASGSLGGDDGGLLTSAQTSVPGHQNDVFYRDALCFTFHLADFDLDVDQFAVTDGKFAWGSAFQEQLTFTIVPLPAPALMASIGLLAVAALRRRQKA